MKQFTFEWDEDKNLSNQDEHEVSFEEAQNAFLDEQRVIARDEKHSEEEPRLFCVGKVGDRVLTVRFTYRGDTIRIIGAGHWRKWRKYYEQKRN